jgi:hypothetical protein
MRTWGIAVFAGVVLAQIAVPVVMIVRYERTLAVGQSFKFRTAPFDPYDAFRGRYVALRFDQTQARGEGANFNNGDAAFVTVEADPDGFARFPAIALRPPSQGAYLKVHATYSIGDRVNFDLPFDRFYMEETAAPAADRAYVEHSRGRDRDAYALVRVLDGLGVIEEVYVGGKPIAEFVRSGQDRSE